MKLKVPFDFRGEVIPAGKEIYGIPDDLLKKLRENGHILEEAVPEEAPVEIPLIKRTRAALDAIAAELGIDADAIKKAKNKDAVVAMIVAAKTRAGDSETTGEGDHGE